MIYLLEIDTWDPAVAGVVTRRFGTAPFFTGPSDTPANVDFDPRIVDPGNFDRHLFAQGRTAGESEVGAGAITLANPDGAVDFFLELGFDGRTARLYSLDSETSPWSARETVLIGTMEQATFPSQLVELRIRDRLALLRVPILTQKYLGTTISGAATDAEGGKDLKDAKKPRLYGRRLNFTPVQVDAFNYIYQISDGAISGVAFVRDSMIPLTFTSNVATLAALKALSLTGGQYATCLALGLIRTATRPAGALTVEATEGATLADRSAARIVQRMLAGIANVVAADFDALHAVVPAECGIWIQSGDMEILSAAQLILGSIGASLSPDRFGNFRVRQLALPSGAPVTTIETSQIIDQGEKLTRAAPGDDGEGVPAWKITVRYAVNDAVLEFGEVGTAATPAAKTFAEQQWRQVVIENAATKTVHPLAPELSFDTLLITESDATTAANRLMAIYGARRDIFNIVVASDEIPTLDLGEVFSLEVDRFGMGNGRLFRVLGLTTTLAVNLTTIEAWG